MIWKYFLQQRNLQLGRHVRRTRRKLQQHQARQHSHETKRRKQDQQKPGVGYPLRFTFGKATVAEVQSRGHG